MKVLTLRLVIYGWTGGTRTNVIQFVSSESAML